MNRLACVDVPALPLQILLRRHPQWRDEPTAVLTEDRVHARIRWANRQAVRRGVRPGMPQVAAAACCPELRMGHVREKEVESEVARLAERLHRWSPQVESASTLGAQLSSFAAAGSFWLRASGLSTLFGPLPVWAEALRRDLAEAGFQTSVAVGFTRFGAFAAARAVFGQQIFGRPEEERRAAGHAPLVRFGLSQRTLSGLEKLGVRRLRDLLRLPGRELGSRFGNEARQLHRLASGEIEALASRVFTSDPPVERRVRFESAETDRERLVFHAKRLLDRILEELGGRGLAVIGLNYEIHREDGSRTTGSVLPALPSEDGVRLLSLLRLRLANEFGQQKSGEQDPSGIQGPGISSFVLRARGGAPVIERPDLFRSAWGEAGTGVSRDPRRAAEALARIQAEFGEEALVRIEIREAHLPRSRYRARPVSPREAVAPRRRSAASSRGGGLQTGTAQGSPHRGCETPEPTFGPDTPERRPGIRLSADPPGTIVRRIYEQPLILPHRSGGEPDGWLLRGIQHGPVESFAGPYRVSGGWWSRFSGRPIHRDYFFVRLKASAGRTAAGTAGHGEVCWVFYDREHRSWHLQGRVE